MPIFKKLLGVSGSFFRIGAANSGGFGIKNNSGVMEVREGDDSDFQIARGKDPVGLDDLTTKRYVDNGDVLLLDSARNANLTNSYLRCGGNTPLNQSPFVVPYDAELFAVSTSTNAVETYDIEIYKNADIVSPPTVGNAIHVYSTTSTSSDKEILSSVVSISEDDEIAIFIRGNNINKPHVTLHCRKV